MLPGVLQKLTNQARAMLDQEREDAESDEVASDSHDSRQAEARERLPV
jgi:hypothetical protein